MGLEWGGHSTEAGEAVVMIQVNADGGLDYSWYGEKWSYCRYNFEGRNWLLGCRL